jgi:hypothetical protein
MRGRRAVSNVLDSETDVSRGLEPHGLEPFTEPEVAGGSIEPRVERSGTLG